jgi:hypothetical protein
VGDGMWNGVFMTRSVAINATELITKEEAATV